MTRGRRNPSYRTWAFLSVLALSGTVACSESTSNTGLDASTDASFDAAIDRLTDTADAGLDDGQNDAVPITDAQAEDGGGSGDGPNVVCEALLDGSCSPAPEPSVPECNGCYDVRGSSYDMDAKCVHSAEPETLICTTVCLSYPVQQCYVREADGSVEILLLGSLFDSDQFQQETGLTECDDALNQEVVNAPICD